MRAIRTFGVRVDREAMLGTFFGGRPDRRHTVLGFAFHLVISGGFGSLYDVAFARLRRTDAATGALLAPAHLLLSGAFFAQIDRMHPLVPAVFPDPGPFFVRHGAKGPFLVLLVKAAFGASVAELERRMEGA
jgi:hypothetical protein